MPKILIAKIQLSKLVAYPQLRGHPKVIKVEIRVHSIKSNTFLKTEAETAGKSNHFRSSKIDPSQKF